MQRSSRRASLAPQNGALRLVDHVTAHARPESQRSGLGLGIDLIEESEAGARLCRIVRTWMRVRRLHALVRAMRKRR